jgi:hypothetical protein
VLPEQRGDPLLSLRMSDAPGESNRAWLVDPQAAAEDNAGLAAADHDPVRACDRAPDRLSAPLLHELRRRADAVQTLEASKQAIRSTVKDAFRTDEAMGKFLGNQLAFDRAEGERQRASLPTWHGFVDVGGVGATNTQMSRFAGDALLSAVHCAAAATADELNRALSLTGADRIEVFAVGGDEVRFMTSSQELAELYEQQFMRDMQLTTINGVTGETVSAMKDVSMIDVPVYTGTGSSKKAAEAASNAQKDSDLGRVPGRLPPRYSVQEVAAP